MSDSARRWIVATALVGACVAPAAPAGAGDVYATSYDMEVRCFPAESRLEGRARIRLREAGRSAGELRFWLHGDLRVQSVRAQGEDLTVRQSPKRYLWDYSLVGNRVSVDLPGGEVPDGIEVVWGGFFHPSQARSPSDYMRIDESGVFLRALGYSPWFPILLEPDEDVHPADFPRVSVEVPRGLVAVFAGRCLGSRETGETIRHVWSAHDLSLFDAQLTARPFVVESVGDVHVYALDRDESVASSGRVLDFTRFLLGYYAGHYAGEAVPGPVHVVEMPPYGDVASGNVVGIREESWRAFHESDWAKRTLAHELVHSFVRPAISRTDPLYALVVEAFPSFYHLPALAAAGAIDYERTIAGIREAYLSRRETGRDRRGRPLPEEKPLSRISAEEIGTYKDVFVLADRAVLFLDELRSRLGQSGFDELNRALLARESLDDATFRGLVLERLPAFGEELSLWLDTTELPPGLSDR